jgi:glycosyltransferase involved in cell wall biosynthesis
VEVILVIYGDIEQVTGGYLYDRKVVCRLREKGMGIRVMSLPKRPYLIAVLQGVSRTVRDLCRDASRKDGNRPLLVVDELTHPSFFLPLLFRSRPIPQLVTLVHHLRIEERIGLVGKIISRMFEKVLLNRSAYIIVNSSVTESSIRRLLRNHTPVHICRPGCDTFAHLSGPSKKVRAAAAPRDVRLLSVGNIIPRKGHVALVNTLAAMQGLGWSLTIVGRDDRQTRYSKRLHAAIDAGGIGDRVMITGAVDDRELVRLYRESDLFVFPSSHEGYGIALAEALSCGLPYVAFDSGGVREISGHGAADVMEHEKKRGGRKERPIEIENTDTHEGAYRCRGGFLVDRTAPETFRRVLMRLIEDGEFRRRLSVEACERFQELPRWDETGDCFHHALLHAADMAGA